MITVKTNFPQWQATFRRYLAATSKTLEHAMIDKAWWICRRAMRLTRRALQSPIEELGVIGRELDFYKREFKKTGTFRYKTEKSGRIKSKAVFAKRSRARAIVVAKLRLRGGLKGSTGAEIEEMAGKMVNRRIAAIGFVASGWLGAFRKLTGLAKERKTRAELPGRFKSRGTASIAKSAWYPVVTAVNGLEATEIPRVLKVSEDGLIRAIEEERIDIEKYLANKMQKTAREHGVRTN